MAIYINQNKRIKNIFVNVNGDKKSISSAWVNKDGVPTKVFQLNNNESDPYEVAPVSAYSNWNYTLDDVNNTITLHFYIGSETDVIVYGSYEIDGKVYKTYISSNPYPNNYSGFYMFNSQGISHCKNIKTIVFSDNIDISTCTNMCVMFNRCSTLTNIDFGNNFNTSNVTNMELMFQGCSSLIELDLRSFNTKKVTSMSNMFNNCSNLKTIYVTNGKWTTIGKDTERMFYSCGTSSVTYI